jgi:putative transcriptional regulator
MRKTKSPILEAIHETANGLFKAGVMDQVTLREFDRLCLPPVEPMEPECIKRLREQSHVSQAVFAALLNTSVSTVQKWEIGQKRPTGAALKLLNLVKNRGLQVLSNEPRATAVAAKPVRPSGSPLAGSSFSAR